MAALWIARQHKTLTKHNTCTWNRWMLKHTGNNMMRMRTKYFWNQIAVSLNVCLQRLLCCCCGCCCCCCCWDILRSWMMATSSRVMVLSTELRTFKRLQSPTYSNGSQTASHLQLYLNTTVPPSVHCTDSLILHKPQPSVPSTVMNAFNPLNAELNPICHLLALLRVHFLHVSRIRFKSLTLRLLMSYIYGAPILDVSRSHTTTQHSR